jgi:prolyl 4-hydroxylase
MLDARKGFRPDDPLRSLGIRRPLPAGLPTFSAAPEPSGGFRVQERSHFLGPSQCAGLMTLIDARRRPSTITGDTTDRAFRTSQSCDLHAGPPVVDEVNRMLDALVGLPANHGETLQGQRYAQGQRFKLHTDYFEPQSPDYALHTANGGQRTWTAMVYLNQPEEGGATWFERIGRLFQPEPGKLLLWSNLGAAGLPDYDSLHEGQPVIRGTKYIITKWYRERPRL